MEYRARVKVPQWLAAKQRLTFRELEGIVTVRTLKGAILFESAALKTWFPPSVQVEWLDGPPPAGAFGGGLTVASSYRYSPKVPTGHLPAPGLQEKARVWVNNRHQIEIRCPMSCNDRIKNVIGRHWDKTNRCWQWPVSATAARDLARVLDGAYESDDAFDLLVKQGETIETVQVHKTSEDLPDVPVSKTPAWKHQKQAYWFAKDLQAAYLDMFMGTGKTKVTIDIIVNRGHMKTLVITPHAVIEDHIWRKDAAKHAGRPMIVVELDEGNNKAKTDRAKTALEYGETHSLPVVIVTNYETAWREPFSSWTLSVGWDLIAYDEIHRLKSAGGKTSLHVQQLSKRAKQRIGLSGTMMPHSPLDVYAQFRALDSGIFGTSNASFKAKYAIMGGYQGHTVLGYQNEGELRGKIQSITYRATKDVLQLPPEMSTERSFSLEPSAMRLYKQLSDELTAEVEDGRVTAANGLEKLLRLHQITSGYVRTDEGDLTAVSDGKAKLLEDVLIDLAPDEPVVIFGCFHPDLDTIHRICKKLGRESLELSGRRHELERWKLGEAPVLVVQIQSGNAGIDLTRTHYGIYYSVDLNRGNFDQSKARIHRPGQDQSTYYIYLVARNTIDKRIYSGFEEGRNIVEYILGGMGHGSAEMRDLS